MTRSTRHGDHKPEAAGIRAVPAAATPAVRRWRWGTLAAAWLVLAVSLPLPAVDVKGGWLFAGETLPVWLGLLLANGGSVAWVGDRFTGAGEWREWPLACAGLAWLLGNVLFAAGPLVLARAGRSRACAAARWGTPLLLACWAYPAVSHEVEGVQGALRFGYAVMGTAYTLAFIALAPASLPGWYARRPRGFEPILDSDGRT